MLFGHCLPLLTHFAPSPNLLPNPVVSEKTIALNDLTDFQIYADRSTLNDIQNFGAGVVVCQEGGLYPLLSISLHAEKFAFIPAIIMLHHCDWSLVTLLLLLLLLLLLTASPCARLSAIQAYLPYPFTISNTPFQPLHPQNIYRSLQSYRQ